MKGEFYKYAAIALETRTKGVGVNVKLAANNWVGVSVPGVKLSNYLQTGSQMKERRKRKKGDILISYVVYTFAFVHSFQ